MKKPETRDQSNRPFNTWMDHIKTELEKNYIKLGKIKRRENSLT
jgi:hypothetical protein